MLECEMLECEMLECEMIECEGRVVAIEQRLPEEPGKFCTAGLQVESVSKKFPHFGSRRSIRQCWCPVRFPSP